MYSYETMRNLHIKLSQDINLSSNTMAMVEELAINKMNKWEIYGRKNAFALYSNTIFTIFVKRPVHGCCNNGSIVVDFKAPPSQYF